MNNVEIKTDIKDLITIDQSYLKDISTENTILETITNTFMGDDAVPKCLKDKVIETLGSNWFYEYEKNRYMWRGTNNRAIGK